jgi:hypothetical protein
MPGAAAVPPSEAVMPFLRKPPRGRRRANLQIDYPFDRVAYTRWRLRCWGEARLRQGEARLRQGSAVAHRRAGGLWRAALARVRRSDAAPS